MCNVGNAIVRIKMIEWRAEFKWWSDDAADAAAADADALGLSIFFDFLISNGEKDKWRCSAGSGRNWSDSLAAASPGRR